MMTTASEGARDPEKRLDWRQVRILYWREVRAALRERTIVINNILIPIFLYPFLLWAAFSGLMFVMGQTEALQSRVIVRDWPKGHAALRHKLETSSHFQLVESQEPMATLERKISEGLADVLVEFEPARGEGASLAGNFEVRLTYNQSKERSAEARDRVKAIVDQYRSDWLKREARRLGVEAASWQGFTISSRNVASKKQMGAFVLGLLAPVIFVVMVAMGCFYPAVDALAGERERNTWETLMSCAASRLSIVTAKYLYVVTFGGAAGLLNLLAVVLTLRPVFAPLFKHAGQTIECTIPLGAIPVAMVAAMLLAGFVGVGMLMFASFAHTFKEGQAMVTPFYMLILVPVMFVQAPGLSFSLPLACVPVVNVTLMVRESFSGHFLWLQMLITLTFSVGLIAVCLRLAAFILRFEDVVMGSYRGSLARFVRRQLFRRGPVAPLNSVAP
jgi:sodium transport system permease protein